MLVIRLTRVGKKNTPAFRVVVAEKKRAAKRKFIEILGHYNPSMSPKTLVIDKDKALEWMKKGAQPSDTVMNLMCDLGILAKSKKVKTVHGKATKKKDKGKAEEKVEAKTETPAAESVEETDQKDEEVVDDTAEIAPDTTSETTSPEVEAETQSEPAETKE